MSDKEMRRFRHYEALMKKSRKVAGGEKPPSCAKCQYYQPDFKFRKCLHDEEYLHDLTAIRLQSLPLVSSGCEKHRILAPG